MGLHATRGQLIIQPAAPVAVRLRPSQQGFSRSPTLQTAADLFVFQPVAADSLVLNPPADGCH